MCIKESDKIIFKKKQIQRGRERFVVYIVAMLTALAKHSTLSKYDNQAY